MSLQQLMAEDRRLCILRLLAEDADYSHNTSVLQAALGHIGHGVARDVVETDAAWLAEQGLVVTERIAAVTVVRLTNRGADVAAGRAVVPGVKRPSPGI